MRATVTKLTRLSDPFHKESPEIYTGDKFTGYINFPVVGKRFDVEGIKSRAEDWFSSSPIKSIYVHGTGRDKLVLPSDFPDALHLDMSKLDMKPGEMLLATLNSVYLVSDLKND